MSTISSSKPASSLPEIDASDLQAARDFLLASPEGARRTRPIAPTARNGQNHGQTVLRHGITRARFRSGSPTGN